MRTALRYLVFSIVAAALVASGTSIKAAGVTYEAGTGPGQGKHIVLVSGDEEYRSEEALPQLGKILATRHGFRCTVLFAIDPNDGTINPNVSNIPGLEALDSADLMVIYTRFRDLPDDQMQHIVDYLDVGKPLVGIRTATHAFNIPPGKTYSKYSYNAKDADYSQGFGRQILGETWINHHGKHASQSTRGIIANGQESHPILRGIKDGDIWGPSDVYGVRLPLPGDSVPLVLGQVLTGMSKDDSPLEGAKNDPMMPIAWTKTYSGSGGKQGRAFCSTIGAANDLATEGTRRLLVNACYWALGLEDKIAASSDVSLVGPYEPSNFKFNGFKTGVKPEEHQMPRE